MFDKVEQALLKKALGYDYDEVDIVIDKQTGIEKITKHKRHMPPDSRAALLLMRLHQEHRNGDGDDCSRYISLD